MEKDYQAFISDFLVSFCNKKNNELGIKDEDINFYLPILKGVMESRGFSYYDMILEQKKEKETEASLFRRMIISSLIINPNIGWISEDGDKILFETKTIFKVTKPEFDSIVAQFNEVYNNVKIFNFGDNVKTFIL